MNPVDDLNPENLATIRKYAEELSPDGPLIIQLLDEIDGLDEELSDAEAEIERLRERAEPRAVSGSVARTRAGKWQVRWSDGKRRRSVTFDLRHDADAFLADAKRRCRQGEDVN